MFNQVLKGVISLVCSQSLGRPNANTVTARMTIPSGEALAGKELPVDVESSVLTVAW